MAVVGEETAAPSSPLSRERLRTSALSALDDTPTDRQEAPSILCDTRRAPPRLLKRPEVALLQLAEEEDLQSGPCGTGDITINALGGKNLLKMTDRSQVSERGDEESL